jgi:hypothetical protein
MYTQMARRVASATVLAVACHASTAGAQTTPPPAAAPPTPAAAPSTPAAAPSTPAAAPPTPAAAPSQPPPADGSPPTDTPQPPADAPPPPAAAPPPAQAPPQSPAERSAELTPPVSLPTRSEAPANPVNPWFIRPSFDVTAGKDAQWKLTIYGFAEFDAMTDSTRSFGDSINSNVLAHSGTQAASDGRTQVTIRNTRFGVKGTVPEIDGVKTSGVFEGDFFGYDPNPPTTSEAGFFNNPTFRIRHAYLKLESDVVDLLGGQMYHLLGWQNYFFPASLGFLGLPNMLFGRTGQVRLSHTFKSDAVNVDLAVAGLRPVQRDSVIPDVEMGARLAVNKWKGMSTPGNGGTAAFPAAIGISGLVRRFKVDQFAPRPSGSSTDTGWTIAADALIPLIPVVDSTDRRNALTLIGEFTIGSADADQFTGMTGGATFPTIPGGGAFASDVDNGLVTYDPLGNGVLHTIDWRTFEVGIQYYLPPTGRAILALNYTQADSDNMAQLFPKAIGVIQKSQYFDANIFFDVTPAARLGVGYQFVRQTFCDNTTSQNHRGEILGLWFF